MTFPADPPLFARWNERAPSAGALALACLGLALLTGGLLTPFFSVASAYDSLQLLAISNPAGLLLRSLHYWSGQLFVVLTTLHVIEHLLRGGERKLPHWTWLRVATTIPVGLYVMVSGYALKGDAEGELAASILRGFLGELPLLGSSLRGLAVGPEGDATILALQHGAGASLLLLVLVFDHYRRPWPTPRAWVYASGLALALAVVLPPALAPATESVLKGPWYLLGLQELLHWLVSPAWAWLLAGGWLALLAALPWMAPPAARRGKQVLAAGFLLYIVFLAIGACARGPDWSWQPFPGGSSFTDARIYLPASRAADTDVPQVLGQREGCLVCHGDVQGLSPAHAKEALGCSSCHLGNPFTAQEDLAHRDMVLLPGNLEKVEASCGAADCHPSQIERVLASPMTTGRGLVAVNRFAFGESPLPDGDDTLADLGDSPADRHFSQLCDGCHLGVAKTEPGPVEELSRGGFCLACHLVYDDVGEGEVEKRHPRLTVAVSDDHCFGCHSRSSRISTSYQGWHETGRPPGLTADEIRRDASYRVLDDGRVFSRRSEDVHHKAGLACIDCHTSRELMGDGRIIHHEEEAVEIACVDCHRRQEADYLSWAELDDGSRRVLRLRFGTELPEARFLRGQTSGLALDQIREGEDGRPRFVGKLSGRTQPLDPPAPVCGEAIEGHDRLTCSSCHSAWVPTCLGCHTQLTPDGWQELGGSFLTGPPTLGVREDDAGSVVEPFAPGMILTIDREESVLDPASAEALSSRGTFRRLFAPIASHTTSAAGRSCVGCHLDPVTLGFGRGELAYLANETPTFHFEPTWRALRDGLPADAWTGFLAESRSSETTRSDARPLTPGEQRRILLVGACLTCHPDGAGSRERLYGRYREALGELSASCRLPEGWPQEALSGAR